MICHVEVTFRVAFSFCNNINYIFSVSQEIPNLYKRYRKAAGL